MLRLAGVVLPMFAFLNNTPVAAMFVPVVLDWCRRQSLCWKAVWVAAGKSVTLCRPTPDCCI